jgi:hypothetical protein
MGVALPAHADSTHGQRKPAAKAKKTQAQLRPLPSGPTGPVPQIPLDSMAPVPPQVSYQDGQLTIIAPNSTLGEVLRAVRKSTGADIEIPVATDRVVTRLGPGPAQEIMAELLNGSRFNYVLMGSPEKAGSLTRVVLVAKGAGATENAVANNQPMQVQQQQPVPNDAANVAQQDAADVTEPDPPEETGDDTTDQAADADQPPTPPDQQEVKTPQQMLQEMQQRQMQLQQQQPQGAGQPPAPGSVMQQRPQEPPEQ